MHVSKEPIIVLGDAILDVYITGKASRLSPEAPVPVIEVQETVYRLGGAANVASNIKHLGGTPILIGAQGDDTHGGLLGHHLYNKRIANENVTIPNRRQTVKTRIVAGTQQIARLDEETTVPLTPHEESLIIKRLLDVTSTMSVSGIVVADYAKGVVSQSILRATMEIASTKHIPVFLDPKVSHRDIYPQHLTILTPNAKEAAGLARMPATDDNDEAVKDAAAVLLMRYDCKYILVTRGEHGMSLCSYSKHSEDGLKEVRIHTTAQHVFDVSGAGDTVIAALALMYVSGCEMSQAASIANLAAGVVVGKHGTAVVTAVELEDAIINNERVMQVNRK